jgi:hypothetical protein
MNFSRTLILLTMVLPGFIRCAAGAAAVAHSMEVIDPVSGLHWLRLSDSAHPAAPPRLRLERVGDPESDHRPVSARRPICVRAGDRVVLQRDNGSAVQMSLEATALGSGAPGDRVRARIAVTGALVEIRVSGPGAGVLSKGGWR